MSSAMQEANLAGWLEDLKCPGSATEIRAGAARLLQVSNSAGALTGPAFRFMSSTVSSAEHVQHVRQNLAIYNTSKGNKSSSSVPLHPNRVSATEVARTRVKGKDAELNSLRASLEADIRQLALEEGRCRAKTLQAQKTEARAAALSAAGTVMAQDAIQTLCSHSDALEMELKRTSGTETWEDQQSIACICDSVAKGLEESLHGTSSFPDQALERADVKRIASVLLKYGPAQLLDKLQGLANRCCNELHQAVRDKCVGHGISSVPEDEDGKENRACSNSTIVAPMMDPSPTELLKLQQRDHICSFLSVQSKIAKAARARNLARELTDIILSKEIRTAEMELLMFEMENIVKTSGLSSAVQVLQREKDSILYEVKRLEDEEVQICSSWSKIHSFDAAMVETEKCISIAHRYCLTSGKRILIDCGSLRQELLGHLAKQSTKLQDSVQFANRLVQKELLAHQSVSLGAAEAIARIEADSPEESDSQGYRRYSALQHAEKAFLDSAVEPYCSPKEPLAEIMSAVMHGAPASTLLAPEEMLLKTVETLQAAGDKDQLNACIRESTGQSSSCINGSAAPGLVALQSVCRSTSEHSMAMHELAAVLNRVAEEGRRGLEGATAAQDMVTTWWEQLALDATPWVGVAAATREMALMPGVAAWSSEDGFQPEVTRPGSRTARGWQSHVWSLIG